MPEAALRDVMVRPGAEEEYRRDLARREEHSRSVEIPWIQRWLSTKPLPACDPFPTQLVQALHDRLETERLSLIERRPLSISRKEWSSSAALQTALGRSVLSGAGSQEQALAWQGVSRVVERVLERNDSSADEREFLDRAKLRRREDLAGLTG